MLKIVFIVNVNTHANILYICNKKNLLATTFHKDFDYEHYLIHAVAAL